MKRFYLSEESYDDNEKNLLAMVTDSWFGSPAAEVAQSHTKGVLKSDIQHYLVECPKTKGLSC